MFDIPFGILLKEGNSAVVNIEFISGRIPLSYKHMCVTPYGDTFVFRSKEDAELAAIYNNWKYIGEE